MGTTGAEDGATERHFNHPEEELQEMMQVRSSLMRCPSLFDAESTLL